MTKTSEQIIVMAINTQTHNEYPIHNLDEATDWLSYDEIIDCIFKQYYANCKNSTNIVTPKYDYFKEIIEHFYMMIPLPIDEVLKYD